MSETRETVIAALLSCEDGTGTYCGYAEVEAAFDILEALGLVEVADSDLGPCAYLTEAGHAALARAKGAS